MNVNFRWKIK